MSAPAQDHPTSQGPTTVSFNGRSTPTGTPWSPVDPKEIAATATIPVAWLGRTSTEDAQDPTLSLPRQLRKSRAALPPNWVIVAHYYDVESGRKDLDQRGRGTAHEQFDIPIPRDGGIQDLLEAAARPDRPFAAVICESIERVARRTYFGTKVEYELERSGVTLCAADEPISATPGARKATPTLTRRVKQAVAEWYVLQMLELSLEGTIEHIRQGWNIGKPPYGYDAEKVPHPVPAKRAEGRTKHRLAPNPVRGPVVTKIFQMRAVTGLGYDLIADRLNQDLALNPPPEPTRPERRIGRWTASAVREIIINPKYTGYMVYNRRDSKNGGRHNKRADWIWSPRPVHEPLVTKELYDIVTVEAAGRNRSRADHGLNPHPQAERTYLMRSYIRCEICGRRMWGKAKPKGYDYFICEKDRRQHKTEPWYEQHPTSVWLRADKIEELVHDFFATRIFGPDRHTLLEADLGDQIRADNAAAAHADLAAALGNEIEALQRRQDRLIEELETLGDGGEDPGELRAMRSTIQRRFIEIGRQIEAKREEREQERNSAVAAPRFDIGLIDELPTLPLRLRDAPETLQRALYDAYNLDVRYHKPTARVTITVTVTDITLTVIQHATRTIQEHGVTLKKDQGPSVSDAGPSRTVLPGSPDGIRTRATALRGQRVEREKPQLRASFQGCLRASSRYSATRARATLPQPGPPSLHAQQHAAVCHNSTVTDAVAGRSSLLTHTAPAARQPTPDLEDGRVALPTVDTRRQHHDSTQSD
jgi:site-specific DNA recombinase